MAAQRFSYEPERLFDDLFCLPLPLHDGSPVNSFVCLAQDGVWLIDGGFDSQWCQATLRAGLRTLGYDLSDVRGLLITHGHTDHVGVGPAVAAQGGAIAAHRMEAAYGRRLAFDQGWLERNGLPAHTADVPWGNRATWPEPTHLIEDGEVLRWGNLQLHVLWCPGHTPGLVCLYEPERGIVFTTDHVMRRARAPVTLRFDDDADPLGLYLASVRKLAAVAGTASTVLPGHGRPFQDLPGRLAQIERDIARDLEALLAALRCGPASAYALLSYSTAAGGREVSERYGLSLVLARLRYLERRGHVQRHEHNGTIEYALSQPA